MFCLRMVRLILVTVCCMATLACTPLMRGFSNGELVSNGFPAVTISSTLPPLVEGQCTPFITTDNVLEMPLTWIAVYGEGKPSAPMAIATYSVAPDGMQWDTAATSFPDRPLTGDADFGGHVFSGSTRILCAKGDAFAPLVYSPEELKERGEAIFWLVQRYTAMDLNYWGTKIILEYREPLPAWASTGVGIELFNGSPEMVNFVERAQKAFSLTFACQVTDISRAPYLQGVNHRYLERFIGAMSRRESSVLLSDI